MAPAWLEHGAEATKLAQAVLLGCVQCACMCGPPYVDLWPLLPDVCMHQVAASALVELHRASMQEGAAFEVRGVWLQFPLIDNAGGGGLRG